MSSLTKINNIKAKINPTILHSVNNGVVHFIEKGKDAKLSSLFINGFLEVVPINQDLFVPSKIYLFDFDNFKKTCDGIFLGIVDNTPFALILMLNLHIKIRKIIL